ncbi:BMC domain-containing protein [Salicibibacter cibi]|uniref:BMC domain-containing protein n=1 Tax=Salicibibacter cibi TaxID=2743001 RepID=A0A7T7CGH6_9BACI|nr:BMC domain-containing protein [Salicibibacter cibi]QQK81029.1 BMC domain-containing protein [Salicibibacter cibi]
MIALGLIESIGYTTAVSAADAAVKAANVEILGSETVIGVNGAVGVTIHLSGDVAAVTSAVEAGTSAGESVGEIVSSHVIPRTHSNVKDELLDKFMNKATGQSKDGPKKSQENVPISQGTEKKEKSASAKAKENQGDNANDKNGKSNKA